MNTFSIGLLLIFNKKYLYIVLAIFLFNFSSFASELFPTPDILKDNVNFWIKIYTEVSTSEGLLHDRDYPMIIYGKLHIGSAGKSARKRLIKREKAKVEVMLKNIATLPEAELSEKERGVLALYDKYANRVLISTGIDRFRFQKGQMERYKEGLHRSGAYLDTIRTIFSAYNIPSRVAYLPHVESSFDPTAYSHVGASGLWQFMRSTGKRYMTINYSVDERRDPLIEATAAAKLLSHNFEVLKSWPLAITAYNHGLTGMKRAVQKTGSSDIGVIIKKHKSRSFQFASKNFYGCFLAASEIAMNANKYFSNVAYAEPLRYKSFILSYYTRPRTISTTTGIPFNELKRLNPAIRPVVYSNNSLIPKGTLIKIPFDLSPDKITSELSNLPDSLTIITPPRPKFYKVKRGDNLYKIAAKFNVTAKEIAVENSISKLNKIYVGQVLRIPGSVKTVASVKNPVAKKKKSKEIVRVKDKELDEILSTSADTIAEYKVSVGGGRSFRFDGDIYDFSVKFPTNNIAVIKVSIDETLGHYADWLGIATSKIRALNRMGRRSTIRINRSLKIPATKDEIQLFTQKRVEYHMSMEEDFYNQFRVSELKKKSIKRGETLWDISNSSDGPIPMWLLKKHNKNIDFEKLFPNTNIWIPIISDAKASDESETKSSWRGFFPAYYEPNTTGYRPAEILP